MTDTQPIKQPVLPLTVVSDTFSVTAEWFTVAKPVPTAKDNTTQLGVHFEEVAEMLDAVVATSANSAMLLRDAKLAMHALAEHTKAQGDIYVPHHMRKAMLDALCDQIVTAVGVAHTNGMHIVPALAEVNRSNFSKFVDGKPLLNEDRKIIKGPQYSAPDLTPFC